MSSIDTVGQSQCVTAPPSRGYNRGSGGYSYEEPDDTLTHESYAGMQSQGLGACHIACGFLFIISNCIAIYEKRSWEVLVVYGIWGGLLFISTGCLGIVSGSQKTKCKIVTFMVLSTVSAGVTALALGLAITGCVRASHNSEESVALAMNATMVFLSVGEAVVAIWSSAICCDAVCCGTKKRQTNTAPKQYVATTDCRCGAGSVTLQPKPAYSVQTEAQEHDFVPIYPEDGSTVHEPPLASCDETNTHIQL